MPFSYCTDDTLKNNSVSSQTFSALKELSRTFKTVFRFKLREKERSSSAAKIDVLKKKCTRIKDKNRIYWNLQKKLSNNLMKCTTSCENRIHDIFFSSLSLQTFQHTTRMRGLETRQTLNSVL